MTHTRHSFPVLSLLTACLLGAVVLILVTPCLSRAQALADYTMTPPFIPNTVPPNVLLLMDNSGSMNKVAYSDPFDTTKSYNGIFDPLDCYTYGSSKFSPDPAANPTVPGLCTNSSYPWSGNLLNYATMRRIDIVKWAMIGGTCATGSRDAQGGCSQLLGQSTYDSGACCHDAQQTITVAQASGRMPVAQIPGSGNLYFNLMGDISALRGTVCLDNDSTAPVTTCSDNDPYAETVWQLRSDQLTPATGILQQVGTKARFGLMEFKSSGDGGKVLADIGSSVASLITAVETTTPATWTPLAESLYEATRYFAQVAPAFTSTDYSYTVPTRDPYYFTQPNWLTTAQYVNCCKSFVIIFTDGEPTQDLNIPSAIRDYGHGSHATHCTSPNPADPCSGHKTNYNNNGTHYLDDVAFYAHTNDLRQASLPVIGGSGKDLPGFQNLTIYTFYAFGETIGHEILETTAKLGGFEDKNNNQKPDLTEEWDRVNNLTGAAGADGIPDTFFESTNAETLRDRLMGAITSILQRSASGTAVSVLANSSNGEGSVYQSYFYPTVFQGLDQISWLGYTQSLFIDGYGNLREDTDGDYRLVYTADKIITSRYDNNQQSGTYGQVVIDRYDDTNGDGKADSATPSSASNPLATIHGVWEAGYQLALKDPTARVLRTWADLNNDGLVQSNEQLDFSSTNAATLAPFLRASASGAFTSTNLIDFIRGMSITGLREREIAVPTGSTTLKTWKLGDVINANPVVVDAPIDRWDRTYGDASYTDFYQLYKTRRRVIYVGANDGMLHAFNGGYYHRNDDPTTSNQVEHGWFTTAPNDNASGVPLGDELWGFIPYQLLPHLQWLARTDYTHVSYVDMTPTIADVQIFTPDATHPNGWGTILIGGFRMGGSCGACVASTGAPPMTVTANFGNGSTETRTFYSAYFVLDITNPEIPPTLLWSYSDSTLGLTLNKPVVIRLNPTTDAKTSQTNAVWYAVFPSGPTGYDGSAAQVPSLFAINLANGPGTANANVTKFIADSVNGFLTEPAAIDMNLDYRVDGLYVGSTLAHGAQPWTGKLYRLLTPCPAAPCTPQTWGIQSGSARVPTQVLDTFPNTQTTSLGPVTAKPSLSLDDTSNLWIFVGTGRYLSNADKVSTDPQYLVGVKDPVLSGRCTDTTLTGCLAPNLLDVSAAQVCVVCTNSIQQVSGIAGVTTFQSLIGLIQSKDGWSLTLPNSRERITTPATVFGGAVFVPSFAPINDICSSIGTSSLYGLFYLTGSANTSPILNTQPGANGQVTSNISVSTGDGGMGSAINIHVGSLGTGATGGNSTGGGCMSGMTGIMQTSSGAMTQLCMKPPLTSVSRYLSWINQRD